MAQKKSSGGADSIPPDSQPNRADQALQELVAKQQPPQMNMFMPQPGLEAQVPAAAQTPLHPIVKAIMEHMGLLNLIRNRRNQALVDPEKQTDPTSGY